MMKKTFLLTVFILTFLISWNTVKAQLELRTSFIKFSESLGYLVKPGIGYELSYIGYEWDSRIQVGASLGFLPLKTWLDTVPNTYAYFSSGNTVLLPGYTVYSKIRNYSLGFNIDYRILDNDISPVVGTDFYVYYFEYSYHSVVPGISDMQAVNSSEMSFGIIPRIGVSYTLSDDLVIEGGLGRALNFDRSFHPVNFWKIYAGVIYYFNNY